MDVVQCPFTLKVSMKKQYCNRRSEGAPSKEANPPTSPGNRTPPHQKINTQNDDNNDNSTKLKGKRSAWY